MDFEYYLNIEYIIDAVELQNRVLDLVRVLNFSCSALNATKRIL